MSLVGVSIAKADIMWTSLETPVSVWTFGATVTDTIDMDNDGTPELTLSAGISSAGARGEDGTRYVIYESPPPNIGGPIESLPAGFEIGPSVGPSPLAWFESTSFAPYIICVTPGCVSRFEINGIPQYMGVEFTRYDGVHYGWLRIFSGGTSAAVSVTEWAWESEPGIPIIAGAIPEPSTFLLLALGGTVLLALRKRG